jgi:hypothetical protein
MIITRTITKNVERCGECPYFKSIPEMGFTLNYCEHPSHPNFGKYGYGDELKDIIGSYTTKISDSCPELVRS